MECTLYQNTGFNLINVPDSPTLLNTNASIQSSVLDCIQNKFLESISVSISWSSAQLVDYVNCDGFYYFVTGITMTSYDVAKFTLIPDFITSAGGPSSLTILDGVTERHHVSKSSDTYGAYNESDPLVSPAQPEQIVFGAHPHIGSTSAGQTSGNLAICEASIDLYQIGEDYANGKFEAITCTDDASNSVTVPSIQAASQTTEFVLDSSAASTHTLGTTLFVSSSGNIPDAIAYARALGVEDAIVGQYSIPGGMVEYTTDSDKIGVLTKLTGVSENTSTGLAWEYATVNNERVLYGDSNRYGILSAAGNSYEANGEDIYNSGETSPSILMKVDPRENGKPYFNFDTYRNESNNSVVTFFRNAIGGMEWRNVPLRFVEKSGSVQDSYNFYSKLASMDNSNANAAFNYSQNQLTSGIQLAGGAVAGVANGIGNILSGKVGEGVGGIIDTGINTAVSGINMYTASQNEQYRQEQYNIARNRELYNFGVAQSVVTPSIKFPYQTPSIRDYIGNGCISYRYRYTPSDVTRIDKILTAYGYKHTAVLESSFFSNRTYFNYIKATGVTVGNNLPNWWKSGIQNQFANGLRIWHVKPNPSYYNSGNP